MGANDTDQFDPAALSPGDQIRYIPEDKLYTIDRRKDDDSGWWLTDGGGLNDRVWLSTGQWELAPSVSPDVDELLAMPTDIGTDYDGDTAGQAALLHDLNEQRCRDLEEANNQPGALENAFDALKMLVTLEHIALKLDIADEVSLDFEGRRGHMLDEIETKRAEMKAAQEAAERQQRLAGGPIGIRGGVPMRPGRGGVVGPV